MSGFQLAETIRKDNRHKKTPIIIISSLAKNEYKRKGLKAGAQAYFTKGDFNQNHFLDTVKRLV
jgi:two-component system chemotaxis sensor kinase CheA